MVKKSDYKQNIVIGCRICGKRTYAGKARAKHVLRVTAGDKKGSIYRGCEGGYHVTTTIRK